MHQTITDFLQHLRAEGRHETARGYLDGLGPYWNWLAERNLDPLKITAQDASAFQRWLAEEYRNPRTRLPLSRATQSLRLSHVRSYYDWMERRGLILRSVMKTLILPRVHKHTTVRDYLSLQEATALVQTQARHVQNLPPASLAWARELRYLATLCLFLATGRRYSGIRELRVQDLNFERLEIRAEKEKGKTGRVLPVAAWAMSVAKEYVESARPLLPTSKLTDTLFVGKDKPCLCKQGFNRFLRCLHARCVEENPDLTELPGKRLSSHSLRVSFATLLFQGGCNLRSVNELMMHNRLSTTAYYTPIPLEDLRRICRVAHPRA